MQPLQICIGPIIRIGRESWCLPYAGFFLAISFSLLNLYTKEKYASCYGFQYMTFSGFGNNIKPRLVLHY